MPTVDLFEKFGSDGNAPSCTKPAECCVPVIIIMMHVVLGWALVVIGVAMIDVNLVVCHYGLMKRISICSRVI